MCSVEEISDAHSAFCFRLHFKQTQHTSPTAFHEEIVTVSDDDLCIAPYFAISLLLLDQGSPEDQATRGVEGISIGPWLKTSDGAFDGFGMVRPINKAISFC